jgi:hypothetical protein
MDKDEWERKMACCDSEVQCGHCPLRAENRHKSVKELFQETMR